MPLIPAFRRLRQEDLCEFEASLVYRESFRTGSKSYRETLSRQKKLPHLINYLQGRNGTESENLSYNRTGRSWQEVNQAMLPKKNIGYLKYHRRGTQWLWD